MREISDGIWHWTAFRDTIGEEVSSYWIEPAGIVVDPMVPPDAGPDWWDDRDVRPRQVVLTIGLHWRDSGEFAERFGIPVRAPAAAAHRFEGTDRRWESYEPGDDLAPGVTAVEVGAIAPDETALHIAHGPGAVAIADGLIRDQAGGPLSFVPDELMGDDAEAVKAGLRESLRGLLSRDWDVLLLAHGEPVERGGREAVEAFLGS